MPPRSQADFTTPSRLRPPIYRYEADTAHKVMSGVQPIGEVGGRPAFSVKRRGFEAWKYLLLILVVAPLLWNFIVPTAAVVITSLSEAVGLATGVSVFAGLGLGVLIAAALSIWLLYGQWRLDKKRSDLGEARLMFNKAHYRAGDEMSLEYERQLVQPRADMGWVFLHLACVEVVATRQGTDTVYTEKVLWEHSFAPAPLFMNRTLQRAYWHVTLPADLPTPSAGKDHWVTWHLQLHEDWERGLTLTTNYALDIGPPKAEPAPKPREGWGRH